ncbi:MAG: hypothetical protein EAZ85_00930 [Bacteroidetes bacterium]|nr:MAG: hypothetical protein EAZ85_00930 [Bacteroidota bacterium]TAG88117.1 MAG: hypothetical protein EAZ20_09200 [Bacteroidota bacterium]
MFEKIISLSSKKIDKYLLQNYPILWQTKIHFVILYSLIAVNIVVIPIFLLYFFGPYIEQKLDNYQKASVSWLFYSLFLVQIGYYIYHQVININPKKDSLKTFLLRGGLYFVIVLMFISYFAAINSIIYSKVYFWYDKNEVKNDIVQIKRLEMLVDDEKISKYTLPNFEKILQPFLNTDLNKNGNIDQFLVLYTEIKNNKDFCKIDIEAKPEIQAIVKKLKLDHIFEKYLKNIVYQYNKTGVYDYKYWFPSILKILDKYHPKPEYRPESATFISQYNYGDIESVADGFGIPYEFEKEIIKNPTIAFEQIKAREQQNIKEWYQNIFVQFFYVCLFALLLLIIPFYTFYNVFASAVIYLLLEILVQVNYRQLSYFYFLIILFSITCLYALLTYKKHSNWIATGWIIFINLFFLFGVFDTNFHRLITNNFLLFLTYIISIFVMCVWYNQMKKLPLQDNQFYFYRFSNLTPKFLKKIDRYLIQNYPVIWETRIHFVVFYSFFVGNICLALIGNYLIFPDKKPILEWVYLNNTLNLSISLGICVLLLAMYLQKTRPYYTSKEFLTRWVVACVLVVSISSNVLMIPFVNMCKIYYWYDRNEVKEDIIFLNAVDFLVSDSKKFKENFIKSKLNKNKDVEKYFEKIQTIESIFNKYKNEKTDQTDTEKIIQELSQKLSLEPIIKKYLLGEISNNIHRKYKLTDFTKEYIFPNYINTLKKYGDSKNTQSIPENGYHNSIEDKNLLTLAHYFMFYTKLDFRDNRSCGLGVHKFDKNIYDVIVEKIDKKIISVTNFFLSLILIGYLALSLLIWRHWYLVSNILALILSIIVSIISIFIIVSFPEIKLVVAFCFFNLLVISKYTESYKNKMKPSNIEDIYDILESYQK